MPRRYPTMPHVDLTAETHATALRAVREKTDIYERNTDDIPNSFVRVGDLIDLGMAKIVGKTLQIDLGLGGLKDVDLRGLADGDSIVWDEARGLFVPGSGGGGGGSGVVETVVAGDGIDVDSSDPANPIVTNIGIISVTAGDGSIVVDDYDPRNLVLTVPSSGSSFEPWATGLDTIPVSPDAMDDEFNDESFDSVKWTWINQGGATVQEDSASLEHLILHTPANSGDQYRLLYQTLPGGTWKFRAKVFARMPDLNFAHAGIFVRDSVGGKFYAFGPLYASGQSLLIQAMNSVSSYGGTPSSLARSFDQYVYLEIEYNSTNLIFRWAPSFLPWSPFSFSQNPAFTVALTVAPGSFLGVVPDQIGIMGDSNSGQPVDTYVDWFRRIA